MFAGCVCEVGCLPGVYVGGVFAGCVCEVGFGFDIVSPNYC